MSKKLFCLDCKHIKILDDKTVNKLKYNKFKILEVSSEKIIKEYKKKFLQIN